MKFISNCFSSDPLADDSPDDPLGGRSSSFDYYENYEGK
jgi:hypothetical protein